MFFFSIFQHGLQPCPIHHDKLFGPVFIRFGDKKFFFVIFFHDRNMYWKWYISNFWTDITVGQAFQRFLMNSNAGWLLPTAPNGPASIFWWTICEIFHRILIYLRNEQNSQLPFIIFVRYVYLSSLLDLIGGLQFWLKQKTWQKKIKYIFNI